MKLFRVYTRSSEYLHRVIDLNDPTLLTVCLETWVEIVAK